MAQYSNINFLPTNWLSYGHLLIYSILYGTMIWHSFIAGILLFKRLPKQQFSLVQSILFPPYFTLNSIALVLLSAIQFRESSYHINIQAILLVLCALFSLTNQLYIGPKTTRLMFQRQSLERDSDKGDVKNNDEYKRLSSQFGVYHGISSLLNLLIVIGLTVHGIYISNTLANTTSRILNTLNL